MFNFKKGEIIIFSFFILLSLIITYPLVLKINHSIFGDPAWTFDSLGSLYSIWWAKFAWLNKYPVTFNHLIAYPSGLDMSGEVTQPCLSYPMLFLSLWQNEFFAYNFFILASFILSAIITYYLVFYLTREKLGSMMAGIIFSFCPYHSLKAFSHFGLAAIQWMPLYILILFKFAGGKSYRNGLFLALSFVLLTLSSFYYGYFMVLFTAAFFLFKIIYKLFNRKYEVSSKKRLENFKIVMFTLLIVVLLLLPSTYQTIKNIILPSEQTTSFIKYVQPYTDLFRYAAKPYDYILPSEYHPLFGNFTKKIIEKVTGGRRYWSETTLYLGIVPLLLAVVGVWGWIGHHRQKLIEPGENFYVPFFLLTAFFSFYFSLAPVIKLWKIKIPTPSFFLYRFFPMFRVNARVGILVILSVAVLAAFGLRNIILRIKKRSQQIFLSLVFSGLILFEYTVIPPFRNVDFRKVPPVYSWLAEEPADIVIAEYPLYDWINENHYRYLFYQRVHQKKMINGAPAGSKGEEIRKTVLDILNPQSFSVLSKLGVNYLIVHKDVYDDKALSILDNTEDLKFIKDFPEARIYQIKRGQATFN